MDDDAPSGPSWGRQIASWVATLAGLLVLVQLAGWVRAPSLPDAAPPFALADLDGSLVSLADFQGRTVILNFWATWCGPCRVEIPSFSAFADAHPEMTVLGIAADGDPAKLRRTARDLGMTYPVLRADRATLAAYGVTTYPTTVIVGPNGEVARAHTGILFRPQLAWLAGTWW